MPTKRAAPTALETLLLLVVILCLFGCILSFLRGCREYDRQAAGFTTTADINPFR